MHCPSCGCQLDPIRQTKIEKSDRSLYYRCPNVTCQNRYWREDQNQKYNGLVNLIQTSEREVNMVLNTRPLK